MVKKADRRAIKKNTPDTAVNQNLAQIIRKRREKLSIKLGYRSLALKVILVAAAGIVLFTQVLTVTIANGQGMFPSIKDGDLVVALRINRGYEQNDVVVYRQDGVRKIGRVAGKAYDLVYMDDSGSLLVNGMSETGEILYPTYAKEGVTYPLQLAEDEIFVLGDYRTKSEDSRDYGAISENEVDGKVIIIIRRRGL
ncbi:MAG: signal peptidase I [Lentihominibacter sp.]